MFHIHHILPLHAGGSNDPSNLVRLTIEEHAIAHKELYEKYGNIKDYLAWKGLDGQISKEEILYELYKENGKRMGILNKGKSPSNKGKQMSEEQKLKLRKPKSEEHKKKLRKPKNDTSNMGKYERTDDHKKQRSAISKEIMQSEEIRLKISNANKNNRESCIFCGLTTNKSNIKRHSDACKSRTPDNFS